MKKSTIYSSVLAIFTVYVSGCSETQLGKEDGSSGGLFMAENAIEYVRMNDVNVGVIQPNPKAAIMRSNGERLSSRGLNLPLVAHMDLLPSHVRGARIYDDFTIELAVTVPGANPILKIASSPVDPNLSNGDSWRCSHCHGFDYEGGVYLFNGGASNNLLELRDVRNRDEEFVIHLLMEGFDAWDPVASVVANVHNYSALLTPQAMVDVSDFVVNEIFDTHEFIRAAASGGLGDPIEGLTMYSSEPAVPGDVPPIIRVDGANFNCASCHGVDGRALAGVDVFNLAWTEPFRWLHRVNFGSPRDQATYPNILAETDGLVHPGLYQVVLTDGLHFGGPQQASDLMAHVQKDAAFLPASLAQLVP